MVILAKLNRRVREVTQRGAEAGDTPAPEARHKLHTRDWDEIAYNVAVSLESNLEISAEVF